jgi:hypothetical protein
MVEAMKKAEGRFRVDPSDTIMIGTYNRIG